MPRIGRVILPNYPHHIVQRGHNRQVVFVQREDYERYLSDLRELKDAFGVKVYAYCLMTNHVHLLLAPDESIAGLSQLMKILSARMTRYRNRLEGRSGTLGREKGTDLFFYSKTGWRVSIRVQKINLSPFLSLFASLAQMGGKTIRSIGLARAQFGLTIKSAVYNLKRMSSLLEMA